MRKSRLSRMLDVARVEAALNRVTKPTLVNPAMGTHAIMMFAIDNREQFAEWMNESASGLPDDETKTQAEVDIFLDALHRAIDSAMVAHELQPNVRFIKLPPHMQPDAPYMP